MSDDKLPDYPKDDPCSFGYEVARTAVDAATSMLPGASYATGKIIERFIAAPLQKRRDEWFERIGLGLGELEDRFDGFDPSRLSENGDFVSAVFEATQAAMKTAHEEKLQALRNGILNIARGMTIDEVLRGAFFGYIDRFSSAHTRVLKLLAEPQSSPPMVLRAKSMSIGSQIEVLKAAVPESELSGPALDRILSDLARDGLIQDGGLRATGSQSSLLDKRSTRAGDAFLKFVTEPS